MYYPYHLIKNVCKVFKCSPLEACKWLSASCSERFVFSNGVMLAPYCEN